VKGCFEVVVAFSGYIVTTTTSWMLEAGSVSCVINFRLEQVITPSLFRFRSSSPPRVYVDYYFYVEAVAWCMFLPSLRLGHHHRWFLGVFANVFNMWFVRRVAAWWVDGLWL
jgi:hypothetical protein